MREQDETKVNVKKSRNNSIYILSIMLSVLLIIAIGIIVILLARDNAGSSVGSQQMQAQQTDEPIEKLTDSIDIPGYGWLNFKAGITKQNVKIPNPPQNFCGFKVSLLLEDGTVLWTSELIAPGEESDFITFEKALEPGKYENAKLLFNCFCMDEEMTPLNSAETQLILLVS